MTNRGLEPFTIENSIETIILINKSHFSNLSTRKNHLSTASIEPLEFTLDSDSSTHCALIYSSVNRCRSQLSSVVGFHGDGVGARRLCSQTRSYRD